MTKNILDISYISGNSPSKFSGTKKYISTGDIDVDTINLTTVIDVSYDSRPSRADVECAIGDVLFAKMAETSKTILIDETNCHYIYSTGFCSLTPRSEFITSKCLYYLISSPTFLAKKDKFSSGSTQKAITNKGLSKIYVSFPELSEQDYITKQLDLLVSIISKVKTLINSYDNLVKSQFIVMFGNPNVLYSIADKKLSDVGTISTGSTPSMKTPDYYDSNDIQFIKPSDLNESVSYIISCEYYVSEKARNISLIIPKNSVLCSCIGSVGKIGITTCDCTCNQQINVIIPNNNINFLYLAYYLLYIRKQIQDLANAPVVPILNKNNFSKVGIFVPTLDLQNSFATFINQVDKSKFRLKELQTKLETLYKSLLQKYFG